jgi:hypothetical protein
MALQNANTYAGPGSSQAFSTGELTVTGGVTASGGILLKGVTNDWGANHAIGLDNSNGILISKSSGANNTASNKLMGISRNDAAKCATLTGYYDAGTENLILRTDGGVAYRGGLTTWDATSDRRIKTDIIPADLDRCYEIVKSVPLNHFRYTDGHTVAGDTSRLGWIAQDLQPLFPKSVYEKEYTFEDGSGTLDDCLHINTDQLNAAVYGALQKAMQVIESLEARIVALETK